MFLNVFERALITAASHITSSAAPGHAASPDDSGFPQWVWGKVHDQITCREIFANTMFLFIIEIFLLFKKNTAVLNYSCQTLYFLRYCECIESSVFNLTWKRCFTSKFLFPNAICLSKSWFFTVLITIEYNLFLPTLITYIIISIFLKNELDMKKLGKYKSGKWVGTRSKLMHKFQTPGSYSSGCEPSRGHMKNGNMINYKINCP